MIKSFPTGFRGYKESNHELHGCSGLEISGNPSNQWLKNYKENPVNPVKENW